MAVRRWKKNEKDSACSSRKKLHLEVRWPSSPANKEGKGLINEENKLNILLHRDHHAPGFLGCLFSASIPAAEIGLFEGKIAVVSV